MSENFKFNCPHCDRHLSGDTSMIGCDIECPDCKKNIKVPAPVKKSSAAKGSLEPLLSDEEKEKIKNEVKQACGMIKKLKEEMALAIVGQVGLIDQLLIGILSGGHVLVEGVPGLAKTVIIKNLSDCLQAGFQRIQFTPDLLPADIVGSMIYNPKTSEFTTRKGPVFTNILLADEINRCPPKVQSALLEAMAEQQVTIGDTTYKLEQPFLVMATENPLESEGTYPLPDAQLDRFMIKAYIDYPTKEEELEILEFIANGNAKPKLDPILDVKQLLDLRKMANDIYMAQELRQYIVDIVVATRDIGKLSEKLAPLVKFGVSPRATICMTKAARAKALLAGRYYVIPDDIKSIASSILGHRILTTYEADAEEVTSYDIVRKLLDLVPVP